MIMGEPLSHPCGPIISSIRPFDIFSSSNFYYQYSTDDIFSQEQGSECSVWYGKTLGHFFRNEQIFKEGAYKFS